MINLEIITSNTFVLKEPTAISYDNTFTVMKGNETIYVIPARLHFHLRYVVYLFLIHCEAHQL